MFTSGYLRLGGWGEAPLRWHWSLPVAMVLAGGMELRPLSWLFYLGLVLAHEAGHHAVVRRAGRRVIGVDLQGLGGEVRWNGVASPRDQVLMAWGGVLAQLGVMLCAKVLLVIAGGLTEPWLAELEHVCIEVNALVIALNLLPLPTFDGEVAWKALTLLRGREIPARRTILLEVVEREERDEAQAAARVKAEVEAELAELTRTHNERAEAQKTTSSR